MNIHIQKFTKVYKGQVVFQDLDFVFSGQGIQGILGANGTGKTTLMRAIAGLDLSYKGTITRIGSSGKTVQASECTYVSPHPYMLSGTVYDNIRYPLRLRKWSEDQINTRIRALLSAFEIEDLELKTATRLSAGETQKVSLARAIAFRPKILLLDEPTSNIDPESIRIIEKVLSEHQMREEGLVLAITHDIGQAKRFCQKIYVLKNKQLTLRDAEGE